MTAISSTKPNGDAITKALFLWLSPTILTFIACFIFVSLFNSLLTVALSLIGSILIWLFIFILSYFKKSTCHYFVQDPYIITSTFFLFCTGILFFFVRGNESLFEKVSGDLLIFHPILLSVFLFILSNLALLIYKARIILRDVEENNSAECQKYSFKRKSAQEEISLIKEKGSWYVMNSFDNSILSYLIFIFYFLTLASTILTAIIWISQESGSGIYSGLYKHFDMMTTFGGNVQQYAVATIFGNARFFIYESLLVSLLVYVIKKIFEYVSKIEFLGERKNFLILDVQRQSLTEKESHLISEKFYEEYAKTLARYRANVFSKSSLNTKDIFSIEKISGFNLNSPSNEQDKETNNSKS